MKNDAQERTKALLVTRGNRSPIGTLWEVSSESIVQLLIKAFEANGVDTSRLGFRIRYNPRFESVIKRMTERTDISPFYCICEYSPYDDDDMYESSGHIHVKDKNTSRQLNQLLQSSNEKAQIALDDDDPFKAAISMFTSKKNPTLRLAKRKSPAMIALDADMILEWYFMINEPQCNQYNWSLNIINCTGPGRERAVKKFGRRVSMNGSKEKSLEKFDMRQFSKDNYDENREWFKLTIEKSFMRKSRKQYGRKNYQRYAR